MDVSRSLIHTVYNLNALVRARLWAQVLAGMALGIAVGLALSPDADLVSREVGERIASWLALPGLLFLAIIKFIVVPLVLASVIRGIAAGGSGENLGKLGLRTVGFFLITTVIAVIVGLACAVIFEPGQYVDRSLVNQAMAAAAPVSAASQEAPLPIPQRIVAILPANLLAALAQGEMLQIVIGAAILGVAMVALPRAEAKPLLDILGSLQQVCMVIVRWVMRLAPFAVFGLLAEISARIGLASILGMAAYVAVVLIGLLILFAVYLTIAALVGRIGPVRFLKGAREVLLMAFSTSSSAAVMPLTLRTAENEFRIPPAVTRFAVPLGTTINMGGTALYQAAAALFLAQVFGVQIGLAGMTLIVVTAVGAAVGSPGTPGVGIVILASILEGAGIPAAGVALIIGVDRILDMARTVANVTGDLVACTVLHRWSEGEDAVNAPAPTG